MATPSSNLHFILFPLMAQGHMIPMVDIARILAQRGATVTIITTPVNANSLKTVIDRAIEAKLKIQVLELQFPSTEVGLPEGCENFDLLPSASLVFNFFTAMDMLEEPAEKLLRGLSPAPSCIISDNSFPWTTDVAKRLNIPRLVFYGPGCFTFLCIHIVMNTKILEEIESDSEYFVMPGLPDRIEVTKPQVSSWAKGHSKEMMERFERIQEAEKYTYGVVVNSFEELEPKYVEEFAKALGKKVWCIGPVSLCNKNFLDIADRGKKGEVSDLDCVKWMDSKEPRSLVYICLGSLSHAATDQTIELAIGLELSNVHFIWFVRQSSEKFEKWLLEGGYEERMKNRGLIVRGWAPQILILSHESIGGFVTHCGWNSTLEGICAGVPMVTWPHYADQFLNERFIIDVLKVGVRIGVEVPAFFGEQDTYEVMVKREEIKLALESLISNEEEGKIRRKRAAELGEMGKRATEEGGSSHINMTLMIQAITEEVATTTRPVLDIV